MKLILCVVESQSMLQARAGLGFRFVGREAPVTVKGYNKGGIKGGEDVTRMS